MIKDEIKNQLLFIINKMRFENYCEINQTVELKTGEKYKFHIKKLSEAKQ